MTTLFLESLMYLVASAFVYRMYPVCPVAVPLVGGVRFKLEFGQKLFRAIILVLFLLVVFTGYHSFCMRVI